MIGVEILAMEEVATNFAFNWTAALIGGAIIMVILTVVLTCLIFEEPDSWGCWLFNAFIGLVVALLLGVLFGRVDEIPTDYETQYKVTISDEVLVNEFNEKYEIIDQDGKIYTVRERE